jgi:hypothetical protein
MVEKHKEGAEYQSEEEAMRCLSKEDMVKKLREDAQRAVVAATQSSKEAEEAEEMPRWLYVAQERIGRSLVRRACGTGKERDIQTAMAQARVLVFEIGSTSPFLSEDFQDWRFVITDRVVNGSPVWAAVGGKSFVHRDVDGRMSISDPAEGCGTGYILNMKASPVAVAPTELPSDEWVSCEEATLESQYASAARVEDADGDLYWAHVPDMRITAVHGLDDDDLAMAAALRQLAAPAV